MFLTLVHEDVDLRQIIGVCTGKDSGRHSQRLQRLDRPALNIGKKLTFRSALGYQSSS